MKKLDNIQKLGRTMVDERVYGIIYLIRNNVNNKLYFGQTVRGFNSRYSCKGNGIERVLGFLLEEKRRLRYYNKHLLNSIEKYGTSNFYVDVEFDIAQSKEALDIIEIMYICLYDSSNSKYGYNKDKGGAIGRMTNENKVLMFKEVVCVDTGVVFKSVHDAKTMMGALKVSDVCLGKRKKSGGFRFEFTDGSTPKWISKYRRFKCVETGEIFKSYSEAHITLGINSHHIREVCDGKRKTTNGYSFVWI